MATNNQMEKDFGMEPHATVPRHITRKTNALESVNPKPAGSLLKRRTKVRLKGCGGINGIS